MSWRYLSNTFFAAWYARQILPVQHGMNSGSSNEELAANRANLFAQHQAHVLDDEYYQSYTPALSRITVPLLSVANWGGLGLHLRGNIEGYLGAASEYKWLHTIVGNHYTPFYSEEGRAIQARFFDLGPLALTGMPQGATLIAPRHVFVSSEKRETLLLNGEVNIIQ